MANYYRLEHAFVYIERDIKEITYVFGWLSGYWPSQCDFGCGVASQAEIFLPAKSPKARSRLLLII